MAVSALPMYASQSDAFVVVAPVAVHGNTRKQCDFHTYNMRGWCRAEMLSKVLGSGLRDFYVLEDVDEDVIPVTAEWLDRISLSVFDGDFSCCAMGHRGMISCDKEALMPAILGLYSLVLKRMGRTSAAKLLSPQSHGLSHPNSTAGEVPPKAVMRALGDQMGDEVGDTDKDPAVQRMMADKANFFPSTFTFRSHEGWEEERELFGIMIDLMEEHVADPAAAERRQSKTRMCSSVAAASPAGPASPAAAITAVPTTLLLMDTAVDAM